MKQKTITLGNSVSVTDPCCTDDVMFRGKLKILGGEYKVKVSLDQDKTVKSLTATLKSYKGKKSWKYFEEIGVDSGQAGIFCDTSYRNDEVANGYVGGEFFKDYLAENSSEKEDGERFYAMMSDLTLENDWATYSSGVVSRSGYGDGVYPIYVAKDENENIVGIKLYFI